jgi:hypothetical protein
MPTKREIIGAAFEEIGRADYDFDLQPEDYQAALRKLDGMLATWATSGIRIGYAGTGDTVDVDANIPDWAYEALHLNLALRLAPGIGKTPSPDTQKMARDAYNGLLARCVRAHPKTITGYAGSGSYWPNVAREIEPVRTSDGSTVVIIGGNT